MWVLFVSRESGVRRYNFHCSVLYMLAQIVETNLVN
jgi:hypothetical protein